MFLRPIVLKRFLLLFFLLLLFRLPRVAQSQGRGKVIEIWPEGEVPEQFDHNPSSSEGTKTYEGHIEGVHVPTLTYFPARPGGGETASGGSSSTSELRSAVVVCPGGGYAKLAFDKEGLAVAKWLSKIGVAAFVLKYRHKPYLHPIPLQDGLQAIRYVRAHAKQYGIDPERVGILGFSAGGHLAACTGTLYKHKDGLTGGSLDDVSSRPDIMALIYPVTTMDAEITHAGTRLNLIGDAPTKSTIKVMSPTLNVDEFTPPAFIVHTGADDHVPVENSIYMYQAMLEWKLEVEMHLYADGPHGLGMSQSDEYPVTHEWPLQFEKWMRHVGFLE